MAPRRWQLLSIALLLHRLIPRRTFAVPGRRERWLSPSILCVQCDDREGLGARLVETCKALKQESRGRTISNRGGWQSKDLCSLQLDEFKELLSLVEEPAKLFLKTQGWTYEDREDLEVAVMADQLWANINQPGDWNARHTHGSPSDALFASGVFYPQVEGRSPAALVLHPNASAAIRVVPESMLLALFPPDLPHEVETASDERVSIAFNLVVRWLPGEVLQAAYEGEAEQVASLPDDRDERLGLSAAHLAAEQGHLAVLKVLSESSMQSVSSMGTPLELAAARGHQDVVEFLMRKLEPGQAVVEAALAAAAERGHAKVLAKIREAAPGYFRLSAAAGLASAAAAGHADAVQELLQGKLAETPAARKAMMEAATRGNAEVVDRLLDGGAEVAADSSGQTPLHAAAAGGHVDVVRSLVRKGGASLCSLRDNQNAEALHWAALEGHRAVVEELSATADIDAVSMGSSPGTPLTWAVRGQHLGVVEALLRLRADLGTAEVRPSIEPLPLGHVFVRNGDVLACIKGAEVLKRRGVAAEAAGEDGGAPLHTAARLGAGAIVELLCSSGADLDARDYTGATPLHWAAANGRAAVAKELLRRGASLVPDASKAMALHDAAWAGQHEVARVLLEAGAKVDELDSQGRSALHAAALMSQPDVGALLLKFGAGDFPDAQDSYPLDLARQAVVKAEVISKTLKKYGDVVLARAQRMLELLEKG